MKEFTIGSNEAGQRFDKYLSKLLSQASMSFVFKMLRKKNFTLNNKKAAGNEILKQGDVVKLFLSDETFDKFTAKTKSDKQKQSFKTYSVEELQKLNLKIIYEDAHILAFSKPVGMLSQKASDGDVSVNEYFIGYLLQKGTLTPDSLKTFKPSIANRLDRNTSGLILCGKTLAGLQYLAEIIKNRSLEKYYICLVEGQVKDSMDIEGYLWKNEKTNQVSIHSEKIKEDSAYIKTGINPIGQYFWDFHGNKTAYTQLEIHLYTGKTHQIRAHLASIGHAIVGDYKYGNARQDALTKHFHLKSQLLHAHHIIFPETEGMFSYLSGKVITAEPVGKFEQILKEIKHGNLE